jgi:hypothetical protein
VRLAAGVDRAWRSPARAPPSGARSHRG